MKTSTIKNGILALALTGFIAIQAKPIGNTITIENTTTINVDRISVTIDKNTTDSDFTTIINTLKKHHIAAKFTNIKRNKKDEIIGLKINLKDKKGNSSSTWLKSDNPIADITLGSEKGSLYITSKNNNSFSFKGSHSQSKNFDFNFDDDKNTLTINGKVFNFDEIGEKLKAAFNIEEDENGKRLTIQLNNFDFSWDDDTDDDKKITFQKNTTTPLYYVDGKKTTKKEVDRIQPSAIKSMNVLKGKKAIQKYGKKAKDGVIEIILLKKTVTFHFVNDPTIDKYIIINGKKANFEKLDALARKDQLSTVDFLKPETAMSLYGKKAKDGAIIATTK